MPTRFPNARLTRAGSAHHLAQRVHTLHLRGQQVVTRTVVDAGMPRDAEFGEQGERVLSDLWEQGPIGEVGRKADIPEGPFRDSVLVDVGGRSPGHVGKGCRACFPCNGTLGLKL